MIKLLLFEVSIDQYKVTSRLKVAILQQETRDISIRTYASIPAKCSALS
jgi:hypothetical protein